jgi:site-specific recombinase XerD
MRVLKRAGIKGLRFHDLRHTFATRLAVRGVDLVTIKELLGHSTLEMVLRYSHPSQENMRRAVDMLGTEMSQENLNQLTTNAEEKYAHFLPTWPNSVGRQENVSVITPGLSIS